MQRNKIYDDIIIKYREIKKNQCTRNTVSQGFIHSWYIKVSDAEPCGSASNWLHGHQMATRGQSRSLSVGEHEQMTKRCLKNKSKLVNSVGKLQTIKFLLYYAENRMNKNISFSYYNSEPIERMALLDCIELFISSPNLHKHLSQLHFYVFTLLYCRVSGKTLRGKVNKSKTYLFPCLNLYNLYIYIKYVAYSNVSGLHAAWCVDKYLFIAVCQHVTHSVNQEGELGPLLKLFVPALLHDFIAVT